MSKTKNIVSAFLREQENCITNISENSEDIIKIINILMRLRKKGNKVFTMGNGGSGSTASHFVSDLLKTAITKKNKRFKAISLVDNMPVMLAWANDVSYDDVFVEQLKNHVSSDDVIIGFSGSGKSPNIIKTFKYGKKHGAFCIGITGMSGGLMKKICDICLRVPSNNMLTIESQHLTICHCIITAIRSSGHPLFKYE